MGYLQFGFSQQSYKPYDTVSHNYKKSFLLGFKNRYLKKEKEVKSKFRGKKKKELLKMYKEQFDELKENFDKGELYYEKKNREYLHKILNHIIKYNPELKKHKFYLEFSRMPEPNAYSIGDGTLIIDFDLINFLDNEAQLASVISHEISHYLLHHREKSYEKHVDIVLSKNYRKKIKNIKKTSYNRQSKAESLLKGIVYSKRHKSRKHEYQADSLGLLLFSHTKYNPEEFVNALKKLDSVDVDKDSLSVDFLKKFFSTKHQKFNPEWLEIEDFSEYQYSKDKNWDIDSLKTHPNIKNRILKVEKLIKKHNLKNSNSDFAVDSKFYNDLKRRSVYEQIFTYYYLKEYGQGLYRTLIGLQKNPDDKFLQKMFIKFFEKLNKAKKEFRLGRYVPTINPKKQTDSEQLFINFIDNFSDIEFDRLNKDFKQKFK